MTDLRRLKFAYARGARIQRAEEYWGTFYWETLSSCPPRPRKGCLYRIHPDDEHLQYGFISCGLRSYALNEHNSQSGAEWGEELGGPCYAFAQEFLQGDQRFLFDEEIGQAYFDIPIDEWRMLLLFYAEALADEGL